jgi:hypothetical protein
MSEVKLNLVDAHEILQGTIHGSVADACVAALSAEPETIADLESALERYIKKIDHSSPLTGLRRAVAVDTESWDAGVVIIDLKSRIVAAESSYSQPQREGSIRYHDGEQSTEVPIRYRVAGDWEFLNSLPLYQASRASRGKERLANPPIDTRAVLYGRALLEFIVTNVRQTSVCPEAKSPSQSGDSGLVALAAPDSPAQATDESFQEALASEVSGIHARWLMTPRDDLRGESPRDVMLAKRDFIDSDLDTRALQWSIQGEAPPCLKAETFAYRFAGFGTHEYVLYYDLMRHLIWRALTCQSFGNEIEASISHLELIKRDWLENPQTDSAGRTPANIIENERRRLPLALTRSEMIIDEDCYTCVMVANDPTMGPGFMHFDGSHLEDEFAFSFLRTREEWDEENRRRKEFDREFNRRWEERQQRLARGEPVEDEFNLDWVDSLNESKDPLLLQDDSDETQPIQ